MENYYSVFDKIIGYESVKKTLMPICDMFRNPEKYKKLGVIMPSGALLQGEPGFGKTLMAKCFIEACGVQYFTCRKDKSDGEFLNYMKKCFEDAETCAPAIVFLDDMDKFANEDQDHKNAEEYVAVQACIDSVKGKNVFVIATTNELNNLPNSLLRAGRFDIKLTMNGLGKEDQIKLIAHFLKDKPVDTDFNCENIWHILGGDTSCAELEKIINDAALKIAFENKSTITHQDIVEACLKHHFGVVSSLDKEVTEKDKIVAYHEAGHTVVTEILDPGRVGLVSIQAYKEGDNSGVTSYISREMGEYISFKIRENNILADLGGRAATEIVYGTKDMGSGGDINNAKRKVRILRDDYYVYGFTEFDHWNASEESKARADRVVETELNKLYEKAKEIISNNREFLDALANALLEKKTIFSEDIKVIKQNLGLE